MLVLLGFVMMFDQMWHALDREAPAVVSFSVVAIGLLITQLVYGVALKRHFARCDLV